VSSSFGHSAVERRLLAVGLSLLAEKLSSFAVDMDVAPSFGVLVDLNGAGLGNPFELRGISGFKSFLDGCLTPFVLSRRVNLLVGLDQLLLLTCDAVNDSLAL
jgi:hypothetical protein